MDFEDIVKAIIFLAWILSPLFRKKKKQQAEQAEQANQAEPPPVATPEPAPARVPRPARVETPSADEIMRGALDRAVGEANELLSGLDPRLSRLLAPSFEEDILPRARELGDRLSSAASGADSVQLTYEVESLLVDHRQGIERARGFIAARSRDAADPVLDSTDRIVDSLFTPLSSFADRNGLTLDLGPPVAVLEDAARAASARERLGAEALVVPRRVRVEPWRLGSIGRSFGEYLIGTLPGIRDDALEALDTRESAGRSGRDPDAIAQLLAAGWVADVLPDLIAAGILGPAYLRALASELRSPANPSAASVVSVDRAGYAPYAPPHLRIHAVAAWLDALGERERAAAEVAAWDEEHGPPSQLQLSGPTTRGQLPLEPARRTLALAARDLYGLELGALAGRGLAELPDVTDWDSVSLNAERALRDFADGPAADSGTRAIVAAAIEASLDSPTSAVAVHTQLSDALSGRRRRPRVQRRSGAPARRTTRPDRLSPPQIVEALLLEELLLRPRRC